MTFEEAQAVHQEAMDAVVEVMRRYPKIGAVITMFSPDAELLSCRDNVGKKSRLDILQAAYDETKKMVEHH